MRVGFEVRAAAGRVHEDDLGALECGDVLLREPYRLGLVAGVRMERTAARLSRRVDDLGTEVCEYAGRRGVHVSVGRPHDASKNERDGRPR